MAQSPRVRQALEALGANVGRRRRARGLSQEALAERLGVDVRFLQKIERANTTPSLPTIVALADALDLSIGALFRPARLPPTKRGRPRTVRHRRAASL